VAKRSKKRSGKRASKTERAKAKRTPISQVSESHLRKARRVHKSRPKRSRKVDEARAGKVPKYFETWLRNPGRYDLPGVDTPDPAAKAKAAKRLWGILGRLYREAGGTGDRRLYPVRVEFYETGFIKVSNAPGDVVAHKNQRYYNKVKEYAEFLVKRFGLKCSTVRDPTGNVEVCKVREWQGRIIDAVPAEDFVEAVKELARENPRLVMSILMLMSGRADKFTVQVAPKTLLKSVLRKTSEEKIRQAVLGELARKRIDPSSVKTIRLERAMRLDTGGGKAVYSIDGWASEKPASKTAERDKIYFSVFLSRDGRIESVSIYQVPAKYL